MLHFTDDIWPALLKKMITGLPSSSIFLTFPVTAIILSVYFLLADEESFSKSAINEGASILISAVSDLRSLFFLLYSFNPYQAKNPITRITRSNSIFLINFIFSATKWFVIKLL